MRRLSKIRPSNGICSILCLLGICLAAEVSAETLRIGTTLPLSGDYSFVGTAIQQGMQLALKEIPAGEVEIFYEDEGLVDRARAVSGFQKLVSQNKVDIVLGSTVNTVTAYAPIATRIKIPVISLWDSNASIEKMGEYAFAMGFGTEEAGTQMAEFAAKNLGAKRFAVISAFDEWSELISGAFVARLHDLGKTIVFHENIAIKEGDVGSLVQKAISKQADVIYAPLYLTSLHSVIKRAKDFGYKGKVLVADGMVEADAKALGKTADGVLLTQLWLENQEFKKKFADAHGGETSAVGLSLASLGYDAVRMLALIRSGLLKAGQSLSAETVKSRLSTLDYQGVSGHIHFGPQRTCGQTETIVEVRDGGFTKYSY